MRTGFRRPLLALGLLALLAGLWMGLIRIGWPLPWFKSVQGPLAHGPLMVPGFLGTLIGLERAVALGVQRQPWGYLVPFLAGMGSVALITGHSQVGASLATLAGVGLVAVYGFLIRRQLALFMVIEGGGALALAIGNVVWLLGEPVHRAMPWWIGFLVLTIVGERLELSRLRRLDATACYTFLGAIGLTLIGTAFTIVDFAVGIRVLGVGFLASALWLGVYDVLIRTVRRTGLPRFAAICMGSGLLWLAVGGALALSAGGAIAGPSYDAWVHAVTLGFVFSMIFGHAPIIFPAVLGVRMVFHRGFYVHLALLNLSLVWRLWSDLSGDGPGREGSGLLSALAIVFFLVITGGTIYIGKKRAQRAPRWQED